jgi:hypothetical protein
MTGGLSKESNIIQREAVPSSYTEIICNDVYIQIYTSEPSYLCPRNSD